MMNTLPNRQIQQAGNAKLVKRVLEAVLALGIDEFCVCPGGRNAPLLYPLVNHSQVKVYNWPEERSASFFALGRIKATNRPVAIVTTSGTASAELLPAAMEAYYSGLPLVLITADRPRRFRGTGAPQSAEQVGLFHCYARQMFDLAEEDACDLNSWKREGPLHLNVCLEEPVDGDCQLITLDKCSEKKLPHFLPPFSPDRRYLEFLEKSRFPFVVVGALHPMFHESAVRFLLNLKAPFYAEANSGLREDRRLEHLQITWMDKIWQISAQQGYPIDGILRLGGVPTTRLWRDIEWKGHDIAICSISDLPFSGLSCADVIATPLHPFFDWAAAIDPPKRYPFSDWKNADRVAQSALLQLYEDEPLAEASMVHDLSKLIPRRSKIFLGNSLPIREWDLSAVYVQREFQYACSRGVNGIDGQISTFLGFCSDEQDNWAILGDLTVLYDLAAPWITLQLGLPTANVVVINNGGAGIFKKMYAHPIFVNSHNLSFEPFAQFWNWSYEKWTSVPQAISKSQGMRLIELLPDADATVRFQKRLSNL